MRWYHWNSEHFYTIFQRNENHRKPNQWRKLIKCLARLIKIDAFVPFSLNERIFKGIYYSWMHDHGAIEIHCKQNTTSIVYYFILSLSYARILKTVQILLSCKKLIEALITLFQEEKKSNWETLAILIVFRWNRLFF